MRAYITAVNITITIVVAPVAAAVVAAAAAAAAVVVMIVDPRLIALFSPVWRLFSYNDQCHCSV